MTKNKLGGSMQMPILHILRQVAGIGYCAQSVPLWHYWEARCSPSRDSLRHYLLRWADAKRHNQ